MPGTTKNDEGGSSRSSPSRGRCSTSIAWPSEAPRARPGARDRPGVPPARAADQVAPALVADGDEGGRPPGDDPARPAALGRAEPRARRRQPLGRHEADRHKTEAIFRRYAISSRTIRGKSARSSPRSVTIRALLSYRRLCCVVEVCGIWWAGTGLNRRHQDFQSCALPTELPARQAA